MIGHLKIIGAVLIWAIINGLVIRGISQHISPTTLGALMSLVGLVPLIIFIKRFSLSSRQIRILVFLGVTAALNNSFFYTAIAIKDVSTIVLVHYFAASLAVVWAQWVLNERLNKANILSVLLGLTGLMIMLGRQWFVWAPWMLFATLSAFFYSWEIIYSRIASRENIDPIYSAFSKLSSQMVLMPVVGFFLGHSLNVPAGTVFPIILAGLLLVGSFWLVFDGLRHVSATHFSILAYLDRLGAIAIGFFWWHEPITISILIGGGLILVAEIPILFFRNKKDA